MDNRLQTPASAFAEYRTKGFTHLSGEFSAAEMERVRAEADRIDQMADVFADPARGAIRQGDARGDRMDPVIDVSPLLAEVAADRRLLDLASEFLGGQAQLFKDKYITKPPGTRGYQTHQDFAYWQEMGFAGDRAINVALIIDPCTAQNGAIEFAPGYHTRLLTQPGVVSDPGDSQFDVFEMVTAEPGDLIVFSALAPHRSMANRTDAHRRIFFLTYVCDDRPRLYETYQHDRRFYA